MLFSIDSPNQKQRHDFKPGKTARDHQPAGEYHTIGESLHHVVVFRLLVALADLEHRTTPAGFEPTLGDPIGLAGPRLNHSAKVSLPNKSFILYSQK